jgi:uncharacterized protein YjiS (DUF1127 family)
MGSTVLTEDRYGRELCRPKSTDDRRDPAIFRWLRNPISHTLKVFTEARRISRAYRELRAMNDPELHDIGINRADIPLVMSGAFRRKPRPISDSASSGRQERVAIADRNRQPCDQGASQ